MTTVIIREFYPPGDQTAEPVTARFYLVDSEGQELKSAFTVPGLAGNILGDELVEIADADVEHELTPSDYIVGDTRWAVEIIKDGAVVGGPDYFRLSSAISEIDLAAAIELDEPVAPGSALATALATAQSSGIPEAPITGGPYGRQAGSWAGISSGVDWTVDQGGAKINVANIPTLSTYLSATEHLNAYNHDLIATAVQPEDLAGYSITLLETALQPADLDSHLANYDHSRIAQCVTYNELATGAITPKEGDLNLNSPAFSGGAVTTYLLTGTEIAFSNGEIQRKTLTSDAVMTSTLTAGESVTLRVIGADDHAITLPVAYWLGAPPVWTGDDYVAILHDGASLNGAYLGALVPNETADLSGSVADIGPHTVTNLTSSGSTDWVKLDLVSSALSTIRKASPVVPIGVIATAQTSLVAVNDTTRPSYTWTDGTPTASGDVHSGVILYGSPNATYFELSFPADTTRRIAKLYIGGWNVGIKCSAELEGVELYSETTTHSVIFESVFAVEYVGSAPSQTMTMRIDLVSGVAMSAIMTVYAATLEVA